MPCKLFLLLIPLCRTLIIRWCTNVSRISAARLDNAPRWKFVSEFCSFQIWPEHVTPSFSDGNFRLNVRMLFIGIVDCLPCWNFPLAVKWVLWFTLFTIATDTFSFSDYCAFPFPFRGELVDRFFVCGWTNVQSFPIPILKFLEIFAMRGDAKNHFLNPDYNVLFYNWNTEDDLPFLMGFVCISGILYFCGMVSFHRVLWSMSFASPFLCRVMVERTFPANRTRTFLMSKLDNLFLSVQTLLKSKRLVLGLLSALYERLTCSAVTQECH